MDQPSHALGGSVSNGAAKALSLGHEGIGEREGTVAFFTTIRAANARAEIEMTCLSPPPGDVLAAGRKSTRPPVARRADV